MLRCQVNENLRIDIFYHEGHNPLYRAFQGFGQAKSPDSGLVLGSSQLSILPQLPLKRCSI